MTVKNWSITSDFTSYTAPEMRKYFLCGNVYGNVKFEDGTSIRTSNIIKIEEKNDYKIVHTRNSKYKVFKDDVSEDYENAYPNAYDKLSIIS